MYYLNIKMYVKEIDLLGVRKWKTKKYHTVRTTQIFNRKPARESTKSISQHTYRIRAMHVQF